MEMCGFYVEGVALSIIGSCAILANIFTLYVFLRYVYFELALLIYTTYLLMSQEQIWLANLQFLVAIIEKKHATVSTF